MKKYLLSMMILCCLLISGCSNTAEADATSIPSDTDRTASAETDADSESSDSEVNAVYFSTPELKNGGRSVLFNDDWKFILSDPNHAESTALDDSSWQSVSLPHDWSISTDFTADGEAESGFLLGGTGWYRKTFPFSNDGHKRVTVTFEGVYMNAAVYLNGRKLGSHPYGYTSFSFDLTDDLITDGITENVLAVKVENTMPNSRWYSGSGIERNVYLTATDPLHIEENGIAITSPDLKLQYNDDVDTNTAVTLVNETDQEQTASIRTAVFDGNGIQVSASAEQEISLFAAERKTVTLHNTVNKPDLWSIDNPALYTVETEIIKENKVIDQTSEQFGYRWFSFDNNNGFSLNGTAIKLKGMCMHQDQGALGSVSNARAIDRQMEKLKRMGANAVRVTHNPACEELLTACNKLGILVIDESFDTWSNAKNHNDYDYSMYFNKTISDDNEIIGSRENMTWGEFDIKAMVYSARNDPCVILWSIGNEILGNIGGDTSMYPVYAAKLCEWIQEIDTSRPCTIGDNKIMDGDAIQLAIDEAIVSHGGIIGLNYADAEEYDQIHSDHPDWILYGSETASALSSRGWYSSDGIDKKNYQVSAYDSTSVEWGSSGETAWKDTIQRDFLAGEFVWTGFDYIGEPEPWNGLESGSVTDGSPSPKSSYFGQLDTAGFEKDSYYLYQSLWNQDITVLHILPDWNKEDLKTDFFGNVKVAVYSNAESVELFLNGRSLGRQSMTADTTDLGYSYLSNNGSLYYTWNVNYKSGTLYAKAYDSSGNEIKTVSGRNSVTTSGTPVNAVLTSDRSEITADGRDLCYITVSVTDADGNPVYGADNLFLFSLNGDGIIAGVDNGDPADLSSYAGTAQVSAKRSLFSGKALIIVQSTNKTGSFRLTASAEGLNTASIEINTVNP